MGIMKLKSLVLFTIVFFAVEITSAQTFNFQSVPTEKKQFGVTFNKPFFKDEFNFSFSSNVFELYLNVPVSSRLNILANIPFVQFSYEYKPILYPGYGYDYNRDESGAGNIFIGLQTNPELVDNRKTVISFGLYLPTAEEEVGLAGIYSDYYNLQKYNPNNLGLYFNFAHHRIVDEGLLYAFEVGSNFMIPTEDEGGDTEMFLHYGFNSGYGINKFAINVELLGVFIVTEDPEEFGDRFVHMVNLGAHWRGDVVTPKIFYKFHLNDEMSLGINGVLGIGLNVALD